MLYQVFDPPANLAPYVRFFWALEADVAPGEEFVHRSMADGSVEMVFHYRSAFDEIAADDKLIEASPLASIQAQSTRFRRFVTNERFGIFGVYLYPFAIPRLFGFPASDFTNISPDVESVFGREGVLRDERMCTAPTNEDRIAIIGDFLTANLNAYGVDCSRKTTCPTSRQLRPSRINHAASSPGTSRRPQTIASTTEPPARNSSPSLRICFVTYVGRSAAGPVNSACPAPVAPATPPVAKAV